MSKLKNIRYSKSSLEKLLIFPDKNANKYTRGTCYVIAGSEKYPGAAILCASAANRYGAGYTRLFTHKNNVQASAFKMPSCVCDVFENLDIPKSFESDKPHAFVVGPGFVPNCVENDDFVLKILKESKAQVVLDGGALTSLSVKKVREAILTRASEGSSTVLTPHMGEAKLIYSFYASKQNLSQEKLAIELASLSGATIMLKGPSTFVCNNKQIYQMKNGTPALAKAGSGDVLAGILGAVLCQNKISTFDSCVLASNLHAQAGNLAAKELGEAFVIPEDLI